MIDLGRRCLDDRVKEVDQGLGIGVFEILSMCIGKEASDGLNEFRRHFQLFLGVDFEFEPPHTLE
jgi:hypothetical protein